MAVSDVIAAERAIKWRIFSAVILSFGLLANFANIYFATPGSAWAIQHLIVGPLIAAMLLAMLSEGFEQVWSKRPIVRGLIGDESTHENRIKARSLGFFQQFLPGCY